MPDCRRSGPASEDQGIDLREVWKEGKKWRTLFSWSAAVPPFLLGFLPSLWDIHSDYVYANIWDTDFRSYSSKFWDDSRKQNKNYTYMFICLPVLMLCLTSLPRVMRSLSENLCPGHLRTCAAVIGNTIGLLLLLGVFVGVFCAVFLLQPASLKYLSYPCAAVMLCGKLLPVFIHGHHTRRLAVMLGAHEATYEAVLQLVLVNFGVSGFNHPINITTYSAVLSSLIAISKAGIEKLLMFGEENMMDEPILKKLKTIAKYLPVFAPTSVFRITGFIPVVDRITITFNYLAQVIFGAGFSQAKKMFFIHPTIIFLAMFLPFVTLSLSKCCCLEDLSLSELFEGAVGEFGTITVWGRRGRERSRAIQLPFFLYYLFVYSTVIMLDLLYPPFSLYSNLSVLQKSTRITGLCCGALFLPLFFVQIYYMEKYNILTKLRNLGLSIGI